MNVRAGQVPLLALGLLVTACGPRSEQPVIASDRGTMLLGPEEWTRSGWSVSQFSRLVSVDLNGDGRSDLVMVDPDGTIRAGLSTGRQFSPSPLGTWKISPSALIESGDFDGDGRADLIAIKQGEVATVSVAVSQGDQLRDLGIVGTLALEAHTELLIGDVDGDARVDLVALGASPSGITQVLTSKGTRFASATTWGPAIPGTRFFTGDFDGDGRMDVIGLKEEESSELFVAISDGEHFTTSSWGSWTLAPGTPVVVADFDGDGRDDILKLDPSGGFAWARSTGEAFELDRRSSQEDMSSKLGTEMLSGDFNGDGRTDMLATNARSSPDIAVALSTRSTFLPQAIGGSSSSLPTRCLLGDTNGDGRRDLIQVDTSGKVVVRHGLVPCPRASARSFAPGHTHFVTFARAIDDAPIGTVWSTGQLASSPLAPMLRPVILKADDIRGGIGSGFARYLRYVAEHDIPATLGLIAEKLDGAPAENLRCLASMEPDVLEIWNHGYDHFLNSNKNPEQPAAEFSGTSEETQLEHLLVSQELVKRVLGITMRTFGAPGNGVDESTARALSSMPEIENIFLKPPVPGKRFLPGGQQLEDEHLRILPSAAFIARYQGSCSSLARSQDAGCAPEAAFEPLVLQFHPDNAFWMERDWVDFEAIVTFLEVEDKRGFMTAVGYARWEAEKDRISIRKESERAYVVDLTEASAPLVLRFVEKPTSVFTSRLPGRTSSPVQSGH